MAFMIIKGLFRRYERWNPVHPTIGAFWGMGVGIGCGVGWGPGFGPEVIGFVGAGCGVGFSVGLTLAGVGVGLPAHSLIRMTHGAFEISSNAWGSARLTAIPIVRNINVCLNSIAPHASIFKRKAYECLSSVDVNFNMNKSFEFTEMRKMFINRSRSALSQVEAFKKQLLPGKGQMK